MTSKAYTFEKRFVCMPGVQRTGNNKILGSSGFSVGR